MIQLISKVYMIGYHQMFSKMRVLFQLVEQRNYLEDIWNLVQKLKLKDHFNYQNIQELEFNFNFGKLIHGMMKNSKYILMVKLFGKDHLDLVHLDKQRYVEHHKVHGKLII